MIKPEDFLLVCRSLNAAANRKNISGRGYIQPRLDKDVLLTNCVFLAIRENRILQVSIEDEVSTADAFFKSTGLHDEERLLQLTYPFGSIDYDEAATMFEQWIVDFQDEKLVKRNFKKLFEPSASPPEAAQ
jgi:hypothetical protein